jgi:8-oxo-dGTP diphosphatase
MTAGTAGTAGTERRRAFSVAIYARRGDRVLVIEHRRLRTWLPIGGELEAGETPLEAAHRELREETGLAGRFRPLDGALDGVPPGLLGYEEHQAGEKGLHLNFVFVAEVADGAEVVPNDEFTAWRWVDRAELGGVASPLNVRQFGVLALDARFA